MATSRTHPSALNLLPRAATVVVAQSQATTADVEAVATTNPGLPDPAPPMLRAVTENPQIPGDPDSGQGNPVRAEPEQPEKIDTDSGQPHFLIKQIIVRFHAIWCGWTISVTRQ